VIEVEAGLADRDHAGIFAQLTDAVEIAV